MYKEQRRNGLGYANTTSTTLAQEYPNAIYWMPIAWLSGFMFGATYMLGWHA